MTGYGERALVHGLDSLRRAQEAIAHNMANATSPSFKRRAAYVQGQSFQDAFGEATRTDPGLSFNLDWTQGDLEPTGERTHLALDGDAFLVTRTDDGQTQLSRGGSIRIAPDGTLRVPGGAQLLDESSNAIRVDGNQTFEFDETGRMTLQGPDGLPINGPRVQFGAVPNGVRPQPIGSGAYTLPDGVRPDFTFGTVRLRQGYLERSNVDVMSEMVRMITVQRGFEASSRAMTTMGRFHESYANSIQG